MKKTIFPMMALIVALISVPVASPAANRGPQPATDLQTYLPDGIGVASIDVTQLTGSALWLSLTTSSKPIHAIQSLQNGMADIGLKLTDVTQVALCVPFPSTSNFVAALSGSINQADLLARLRANSRVKLSSEGYKNFQIYTAVVTRQNSTRTQTIAFAFPTSGVVVIGTSRSVQSAIDATKGDKPSLAQDSKMQAGLAQASPGAIRFAVALTPAITGQLQSSSIPLPDFSTVSLAFGTLGVGAGVDLSITLRNDTAANANAMAAQLNSLLSMAKGILGASSTPKNQNILEAVKTVSITASGTDVKVSGSLNQDVLSKVIH